MVFDFAPIREWRSKVESHEHPSRKSQTLRLINSFRHEYERSEHGMSWRGSFQHDVLAQGSTLREATP
jgi:hypothetical protein